MMNGELCINLCVVKFLFYETACFYDIDDIVTQFLAFRDDIHIEDADIVVIEFVVDVHHILVFQLSAVVVYLMLRVVATVQVHIAVAALGYDGGHLAQSFQRQLHHGMYVLILLFCEILSGILAFSADGTGDVVTTVTDTFQF